MRVKPLRDCFANKYYTEGVEDDYDGPPNRHLEPVDKAEKAKWAKATAKPGDKPVADVKPAKPAPVVEEPEPVDLDSMTKAEIVEHAADVHGLELDHNASKADLIDQVKAAEADSSK